MNRIVAKRRNGEIDLLKFLCCWIVAYYHFYGQTDEHFISGRYAVEFFLLSAGVFFFMSAEKMLANPASTPYDYLKKRYWRFFPQTFVAFIFAFVVIRVIIGTIPTFEKGLDYLSGDIWEILLVKMNGMNSGKGLLNGVAWTISAMLIAEFFIFGCLWIFKDKFTHFILPISLLIGYGFWRNVESAGHAVWVGFTTFGVVRAYLTIGLSYYCLKLSRKLGEIQLKTAGKICLSVIGVVLYICVIWIMMFKSSKYYQWTSTLIFAVIIAIALSGHSLINEVASRFRVSSILGEFSMNIYLIHGAVYYIFRHLYSEPYEMYSHKFEFMGAVCLAAVAHYFITKYSIKLVRLIKCGLKNKLTITT